MADFRISGPSTTPRSECDIRINYNDPQKIIAAANDTGNFIQAQFNSKDGGTTWNQTTLPLATGDSLHSDPMVDWTSDGNAWSMTLGIDSTNTNLRVRVYSSANSGDSWTFDSTASGTQTNCDREIMWIDHSPSSSYKDQIYATWHNGTPVWFNRRTAGASAAWQTPQQLSGSETTGVGIGGDVKSNANGDVFVFWQDADGSRKIYLTKSTDGGATFGSVITVASIFANSRKLSIPADSSRKSRVYVSAGCYRSAADDFVCLVWADLSGESGCTTGSGPGTSTSSSCKTRVWFASSNNGGSTWSSPVMINNQSGKNDQAFPRLVVDETDGTLMVAYYDTVADPNRIKTDLYVQTSADFGATWSAATKITTGETDETASTADSGNQYGDYIGLTGNAGVFFPAWTDRRGGAKEEIWSAKVASIRLVTVIADSGSFGNVCVGAFKDEMLVLSNSGFNLVTISDITSSSGDFLLPSVLSYPLTIAPGASLEVPIRFQPTSFGFKSANITIFSNDPTGPRIIDVSGTAGAPELATAIANAGSFGNVCLGSFVDEVLTINNSGTCPLEISAITGSANVLPPSVLSYPLLIDSGDSIDVVIRFQPSTHGTQSGTIAIFSNDPASPHVVAVSGVAPEPKANPIIADSGDFGEVRLGRFTDRDLVINNRGPCPLSVTGIVSSAPTFVTPQVVSFPLTVDGGDSIAVPIRFQPTNRGAATATLTIVSNDPNSPAVVNVSGTAWPPLPIAGTALTGFRLNDNSQHVFFIGTDKYVHELDIAVGGIWADNDLTTLAGAVPPTPTSALAGFPLGPALGPNTKHVFFIGTDNHVYELYFTAGTGWVFNDLTSLARAVPPTPTSALTGHSLSDDSKHVFFIGTDNHVHELFIAPGGRWADNDLTTLAGVGAKPPTPTSALTSHVLSTNSQHVFFIGTDNHVHELFIDGGSWADNDLTALAGAVPPTPASALTSHRLSTNSQHVFFIGTDNHVHELSIDGGSWHDNDLTTLAGAVAPTPTSALTGYPLSDNSKHVFFIGTDNHVHELYFTAGPGWVDNDLTALT